MELKQRAIEQERREEYLKEVEDKYEDIIGEECKKRCSVLEQVIEHGLFFVRQYLLMNIMDKMHQCCKERERERERE